MFKLKSSKFTAKEWIENYFYIVDKQRKKVPFIFNEVQAKFFENQSHRDLILKTRKMGFSSLILAEWTCACIVDENTRAVSMSHEISSTMRLLDRVHYYIENLVIKPKLDVESRSEIKFKDTGSSFWIGTAGARAFGRGDDITHFHASEYDWWEKPDVIYGILEACVPGAYIVIETTANGFGSQFHELWKKGY